MVDGVGVDIVAGIILGSLKVIDSDTVLLVVCNFLVVFYLCRPQLTSMHTKSAATSNRS